MSLAATVKTVGDLTTLTYNYQSTDPVKRKNEAWATVNAFCSTAINAIQKKAMVGMAFRANSFDISYKPWDKASIAQQAATRFYATDAAFQKFLDAVVGPAFGFARDVAWDVVSGFQKVGTTIINVGKNAGEAAENIAKNLNVLLPVALILLGGFFIFRTTAR